MERRILKEWTLRYGDKEFPTMVPGDILTDLFRNGLTEDPYYADNLTRARALLDNEAEYSTRFLLSEKAEKITLVFEGIDTYAEIYVNGALVATTDNMFLKYALDITDKAKLGENAIVVRMLPVKRFLDKEYHGRGCFNQERLQLRKAQCHFGWDWAPELWGYGIWLPVSLEISDGNSVEYDYFDTDINGSVKITTEIAGEGVLEVEIDGKPYGKFPVHSGENKIAVQIKTPELWWPNGYGQQRLYGYTLRLIKDGEIKDEKKGRFAFREIKILEEDVGEGRTGFGFVVNGKRIFAQGSNWVPCSNQTGAIPDGEYEKLLSYAKDARYTMLRNWGGGIYEKEIFYELCDKYGILVWQDMMFSCQDAPENVNIIERITPEIAYQLKRIRRHPCVAIICAGNEWAADNPNQNEPVISFIKECSGRYVPKLRFIPNSPFGYNGNELDMVDSGDTHISCLDKCIYENDISGFRKYIDDNRAQFYSEVTSLGSSRIRSLKKFIPEDKFWPTNDIWETHFVKNPFVLDPELTFVKREERIANELFGQICGAEDFVKKSMIAQGEMLGAEIEYARANKDCYGIMNWMFNDNWGCGTWAVVDKYMELKPVYYYQKRGYKPIIVRYVLQRGKWSLFVINDSNHYYQGRLTYGIKTLDGRVLEQETVTVEVVAGTVLKVAEFTATETFDGDYRFAQFADDTDGTLLFLKPYRKYKWKTALKTEFVKSTQDGIEILLTADEFARTVFIDYPSPVSCSDNYFDMEKGTQKRVFIKGLTKENFRLVSVKTFADVWTE